MSYLWRSRQHHEKTFSYLLRIFLAPTTPARSVYIGIRALHAPPGDAFSAAWCTADRQHVVHIVKDVVTALQLRRSKVRKAGATYAIGSRIYLARKVLLKD